VRKGLERLPRVRFVACYGPTEGTTFTTCHQVPRDFDPSAPSVPLGRPIANTRVYVLDPRMEPAPEGVGGELWIGGDGLARCYFGRPALTAAAFRPAPLAARPGRRLYASGDLARWRSDGLLEFLGRVDDQVKIHGFRIEPGEVESRLLRHQAVREAAAVVCETGASGKRLVAYVVPEAQAEPSPSELRAFVAAGLPDYMVPSAFVTLEALPLTPAGKVDRRALPDPDLAEVHRPEGRVAPRTEVERTLAAIWERILGVETVGVHDDFLDLGGDSILVIQAVARARRAGLALTPRLLLEHPTIDALARVVERLGESEAEQGEVTGEAPLTPSQRWFFEQDFESPHHWNQSLFLAARRKVDLGALAGALARLVEHHDALRARFSGTGSAASQRFVSCSEAGPVPLHRIDLSALSPESATRAMATASEDVQASLDLAEGPMLRAVCFAGPPGERLLLAVHHLVVDGVSWRILLEDLQAAYEALVRRPGEAPELPPKTLSLRRWASELTARSEAPELLAELDLWTAGPWSEVAPLPADLAGASREAGTDRVEVALDRDTTGALLRRVHAAYRTGVDDLLVAATGRALAAWTGAGSVLLDLEGHGREPLGGREHDLSRTVGWLTSVQPVLLRSADLAEPGAAIRAVKERLRSIPAHGIGFGLLRHLASDPAARERVAALPEAEVALNYLGQLDQVLPPDAPFAPAPEPSGAERAAAGRRRYAVEVNAWVSDGRFRLACVYGTATHRRATIEGFARRVEGELRALVEHCLLPDAGGWTPSDFPLAHLDAERLEELLATGAPVEDLYPLTPTQQGMLFHTLHSPALGAYLSQLACRLLGRLDVGAFERAWARVLARHTALRTAFAWDDPEAQLQVVWRDVAVPLALEDWSEMDAAAADARLAAAVADNARAGMDLARAPLMRLLLASRGDGEYLFLVLPPRRARRLVAGDRPLRGLRPLSGGADRATGRAPRAGSRIPWFRGVAGGRGGKGRGGLLARRPRRLPGTGGAPGGRSRPRRCGAPAPRVPPPVRGSLPGARGPGPALEGDSRHPLPGRLGTGLGAPRGT
jgi:non-ribosomal peptide synthase protein (TIGR01720 family)